MNALDLVLVVVLAAAATGGGRLGFLARTLSWVGLGSGLVLATRAVPAAVDLLDDLGPAPVLAGVVGVLLTGGLAGQALGFVAGSSLRLRVPAGRWRSIDRVLGAAVGAGGVALMVWFLVPAMAEVPGSLATQTRQSVIVRGLDRLLPDPPDTMLALRRVIGDDEFPRVFAAIVPAPDVGPPPADSGLGAAAVDRARPSVVQVSGPACRRIQEGTGFVVGLDLVTTNAHVVAGQRATEVVRDDGIRLGATVVVLDPDRDLALLEVRGLDRPALPMRTARQGETGGVFGHPGGGPLRIQPFEAARQVRAEGTDIWDRRRTVRDVLVLAASLAPGDSGAPLIAEDGAVIGVTFAVAPDDPEVAYALAIGELETVLARDRRPTDTGQCLR